MDAVQFRALPEPQTAAQGAAALRGSWFSVHVRERGGATVGLGRVIGDGGWYFHIADMAVLPEHQRRGIGNAILTSLIERIRRVAPPDPRWHLLADPPGQRLPGRHGFVPTAPPSAGMKLARR